MKLIATKNYSYNKRSMVAGDEFEASARDARILQAVGRAKPAAEPEPESEPEPEKPSEKPETKKYKTRRLKADD